MAGGELTVDSQSLDLTPNIEKGLSAITVLAFISFLSSLTIFVYLAYKLIWYLYIRKQAGEAGHDHEHQPKSFQRRVDFALGIDGIFGDNDDGDQKPIDRPRRSSAAGPMPKPPRQPPNQFLILIFNLLLADMHQGVAFFLNAQWLRHEMVHVGTATCFVQGLFVSTGDLSSSCFITMIAIHTYLSVVRRYMMPHRVLYLAIAGIWVFVYAISTIPIAATRNGADEGGFFVRAGAWVSSPPPPFFYNPREKIPLTGQCWVNIAYTDLRLFTHYIFIFIALATTSALYTAIFVSLRRQTRASAASSSSRSGSATSATMSQFQLSHNPAFLIYPVIYILCTLPLALGRIASMAQKNVPLEYMCFAGAMIASNGMFDCMLFGTTRNVIVFASKHEVDRSNTGLETFNFMQTPRTRRYGNMVWVQGGGNRSTVRAAAKESEDRTTGGWWSWQRLGGGGVDKPERALRGHRRAGSRSVSQESLRGPTAIQMDTVTTVVVELERDKDGDARYPDPAASASASVNSADKEYPRAL